MKNIKIMFSVLLMLGFPYFASAHTKDTLTVNNGSKWLVRVVNMAPKQFAYFKYQDYSTTDLTFLTDSNGSSFEFNFSDDSDFNIAYTIYAIDTSANQHAYMSHSRSCVFVVSADSPAVPNIHVVNYDDASCSYNDRSGVKDPGTDFVLDSTH